MDSGLKEWLDREMDSYEVVFRAFNRRLMKKVPLWMALCVAGMVALGFGVGYAWPYVLRVHLPIGVGIAAFVWLCFWVQTRSVSMKKVRKSYEGTFEKLGAPDQAGFARQAPQCGTLDFLNGASDKYPARLTVGPDYWLYFRGGCQVFRVADMQRLRVKEETARVGYNLGDTRVRQNLGVGVSLTVDYRDGTTSAAKSSEAKIYLESTKQLKAAQELIQKRCPKARAMLEAMG